jgi:fructose-bisphosphate aldolase, class I
MTKQILEQTTADLVSKGRGILAADESTSTIGKRFDSIGVENTEDNRKAYRDMLFRAKGFGKYISGVILYDETLRQKAVGGRSFMRDLIEKAGAFSGIKVDTGAKPLPFFANETITEGLDGLATRFKEYGDLGAKFAKWRAVIDISKDIPTSYAIKSNVNALVRYAALAQQAGIVPIIEPEILMDGDHTLEKCAEVTEAVLSTLYHELHTARIHLEGTLLKPNMVISGKKCSTQASPEQVADATVKILRRTVPAAVGGIVFLSGGQSDLEATQHLNIMNAKYDLPWALSFSYGRALQSQALKTWAGKSENVQAAQEALMHRARMNSLAALGKWTLDQERTNTVKVAA